MKNSKISKVPAEALTHLGQSPEVHETAFVADSAELIGDVEVGPYSSIWCGAVLRADLEAIRIGTGSNVQDGCVLHLSRTQGVQIGDRVSIGHRAVVHACRVDDGVLVGMGAIIMDGAHIGEGCIVGAGALVTKDFVAPPGSLVLGSPARVVRELSAEEREANLRLAESYVGVAKTFRARAADSSDR